MEKKYLDIIRFTKQLVGTPSQNGIDSEKKVAVLVSKKLSSFGFSPKIIGNKEHPSVFCRINKNSSGKTVWLESCLDTVPVGDLSRWKYPPLKATVRDSKMYGRGVDCRDKMTFSVFSVAELISGRELHKQVYEKRELAGLVKRGNDGAFSP